MTRQHIVFLTGAGISAESGLSTFHGKDGLWTATLISRQKHQRECANFYLHYKTCNFNYSPYKRFTKWMKLRKTSK